MKTCLCCWKKISNVDFHLNQNQLYQARHELAMDKGQDRIDIMKVTLFSEEGGKQSKHEQASSEEDIISNRHKWNEWLQKQTKRERERD